MADMTIEEALLRLNYLDPTVSVDEAKKKIKKKEKVKDLIKEDNKNKRSTINIHAQKQIDILDKEGY